MTVWLPRNLPLKSVMLWQGESLKVVLDVHAAVQSPSSTRESPVYRPIKMSNAAAASSRACAPKLSQATSPSSSSRGRNDDNSSKSASFSCVRASTGSSSTDNMSHDILNVARLVNRPQVERGGGLDNDGPWQQGHPEPNV